MKRFVLAGLLVFLTVSLASALTLQWEPNTEPDIASYSLYACAVVPATCNNKIADINHPNTTVQIPTPSVTTHYSLSAKDAVPNESGRSNTVTFVVTTAPPAIGTPVVTIGNISSTIITVAVPDGSDGMGGTAKVDLRYAISPIGWGSAPSAVCPAFPCTISGLTPGTKYDFQAVYYRGTFNLDAVFGPVSAPVQATTLVADTMPPAPPKGLEITSATTDTIVITAASADCARVVTSTKGSTSMRWKRTVTCLRA